RSQRSGFIPTSVLIRASTVQILWMAKALSWAIPNAACGMNANSPYRRSFWQIDKNNVGILPQAVEHDLLAIGSDIERSHRRVLSQMGKLARRFRRHIENPEVLSWV